MSGITLRDERVNEYVEIVKSDIGFGGFRFVFDIVSPTGITCRIHTKSVGLNESFTTSYPEGRGFVGVKVKPRNCNKILSIGTPYYALNPELKTILEELKNEGLNVDID